MYPYIDFWGIRIPSYGLCMMVGFLLCGFLYIKKAGRLGATFEDMMIIAAVTVGGALLGGGLLYIFVTYSLEELWNFIKNGDFSFISGGGLVFYGGLIGGVLGAVISSKLLKVSIGVLEKSVVPYIPLGHAIGRIGCLLAGCCHGSEYDGIFAVKSGLLSIDTTFFPIQGVEALCNLVIMTALLFYAKKERPKFNLLFAYLTMYSVMRFMLEFLRGL